MKATVFEIALANDLSFRIDSVVGSKPACFDSFKYCFSRLL